MPAITQVHCLPIDSRCFNQFSPGSNIPEQRRVARRRREVVQHFSISSKQFVKEDNDLTEGLIKQTGRIMMEDLGGENAGIVGSKSLAGTHRAGQEKTFSTQDLCTLLSSRRLLLPTLRPSLNCLATTREAYSRLYAESRGLPLAHGIPIPLLMRQFAKIQSVFPQHPRSIVGEAISSVWNHTVDRAPAERKVLSAVIIASSC
jgi:hypothetical protein